MKLSDYQQVDALVQRRNKLLIDLDHVTDGNYQNSRFGITIIGHYQDDGMINACRNGAVLEIKQRIQLVESELEALNVIVEE